MFTVPLSFPSSLITMTPTPTFTELLLSSILRFSKLAPTANDSKRTLPQLWTGENEIDFFVFQAAAYLLSRSTETLALLMNFSVLRRRKRNCISQKLIGPRLSTRKLVCTPGLVKLISFWIHFPPILI